METQTIIQGVGESSSSGDPVVMLEETKNGRFMAVTVNPSAAAYIVMVRQGIVTQQQSFDLIMETIKKLNARLVKVVLYDVIDLEIKAKIVLEKNDGTVEIEASLSNALALAVGVRCHIYFEDTAFDKAEEQGRKAARDAEAATRDAEDQAALKKLDPKKPMD